MQFAVYIEYKLTTQMSQLKVKTHKHKPHIKIINKNIRTFLQLIKFNSLTTKVFLQLTNY